MIEQVSNHEMFLKHQKPAAAKTSVQPTQQTGQIYSFLYKEQTLIVWL